MIKMDGSEGKQGIPLETRKIKSINSLEHFMPSTFSFTKLLTVAESKRGGENNGVGRGYCGEVVSESVIPLGRFSSPSIVRRKVGVKCVCGVSV